MMFSKNSMLDGTKYDFLKGKLDDNFEIPDNNRSKVIFGYNGVGKTSIYRYIRDFKGDDRITFLDYVDERNDFIKKKKKLQVSADVNRINTLNEEIDNLMGLMSIKNQLKVDYSISSITKATSYGNIIKEAYKDNFNGFVSTRQQMAEICSLMTDIPVKVMIECSDILGETVDLPLELEDYKFSKLFQALTVLDEVVTDEDNSCPVCETAGINIKDKIAHKKIELNERKSELIEVLKKNSIETTEENIDRILYAKTLLSDDALKQEWMICSGDLSRFDSISESISSLLEKRLERDSLLEVAENLYNSLKVNEFKIKNDVSRYFSIATNKVVFSDEKKTLTITLPREVITYSTGEMNLLSFLIRIYEFLGSEKNILILDDPVSSLDIINHYKIVYEIVRATNNGKIIIILTHSIEMINAINSQYSRDFDFYYIDEDNSNIFIQEIPRRDNGKNILTLDIMSSIDEIDLIQALIEKENQPFNDDVHKLFHFDDTFSSERYPNFDNNYFVELINSFTSLSNESFLRNSYNKVLHIVALRVWVEYKIRRILETNEELLSQFVEKPTLASKISVLLNRDGTATADIPGGLNREKLMCKKVMLNQGIHYQSQVMPFAYALNISIQELNDEINSIKVLFD